MSGRANALAGVAIEQWRPGVDADLDMLADVLHAVVHDGAGVSFIVPFTMAEARRFWVDKVLPGVREGTLHVLVARDAGRIVGTVQFELAWPPNQPHRAEVAKLLVHPVARRRGVARALMLALESLARAQGPDVADARHLDRRTRRVALPLARLRRRGRDPALCPRVDDDRARADDDHVQGADGLARPSGAGEG